MKYSFFCRLESLAYAARRQHMLRSGHSIGTSHTLHFPAPASICYNLQRLLGQKVGQALGQKVGQRFMARQINRLTTRFVTALIERENQNARAD
jgi:hypothetical protein